MRLEMTPFRVLTVSYETSSSKNGSRESPKIFSWQRSRELRLELGPPLIGLFLNGAYFLSSELSFLRLDEAGWSCLFLAEAMSLVRFFGLTVSDLIDLTFLNELEPDSGRDEVETVGDFEMGGKRF